jgi:uncharacterized repeat protein (TIGR01451 family)
MAVHDLNLFELDRNAIEEGTLGDDWATLYSGGGSADEFTGIIADVAETNPLGSLGTQFQAGGSKDDLDISPGGATGQHWKWDPGEPLDKDDITNAYAAAYINPVDTGDNNIGDLIIYFGLDRFANNGSAQVGFWFLQDPEFGLTTTPSGGGYLFSGHHVVGDILVQSNFTNGGVINDITVYQWVGSGGSHGTLNLRFTAADCISGPASDDPACATVNQGNTPSPWPFTPKFGTAGTFPQGSFFEGGINISRLVPDAGCFTGFLAETRSSTPFDSRLKDFALGEFDLCSIEVVKSGDELSKVGDDVDYTYTITNTGSITLYRDDITDDVLGDFYLGGIDQSNPLVTGETCGTSLAPGSSCTIDATRTVLDTDPDPLPNTVEVTYRGKSDLTGTAVYDSDDHSVNLFQPGVTVTKTGDELSKIGDPVDYTISVTNTGSPDSPNLINGTIVDTLLGDLLDGANPYVTSSDCSTTLATGSSCTINATRTVLEADPDPLPNTVTVHYNPEGFPNDITASDDHEVELFQPSITFDKTGDTLSKIGDTVNYTITLTNTSSEDTPTLICTITDAALGIDEVKTLTFEEVYQINKSGVIPAGATDPYINIAEVSCTIDGFPNVLNANDNHSVNLFTAEFEISKTGTALSKIGDPVSYTYTIHNLSSDDAPVLELQSLVDDQVGDLTSNAGYDTACDELVYDETCSFSVNWTVPTGALDPYRNTVTATYEVADPFTNSYTHSAYWDVNLFTAEFEISKTGTALSKIGDPVSYTYTIHNLSSSDAPVLELQSLVDDEVGDLTSNAGYDTACDALVFDETCSFSVNWTVPSGALDPYRNTVTATYEVADPFTNSFTHSAYWDVNLFQPAIAVAKTGPEYSKLGDVVNYTITLSNTSSGDTPALNCVATDSLLGEVFNDVLPAGDTVLNPSRTVQEGDPDPLVNTVTLTCSPEGFPNVLEETASHSVDLIHPSFTVAKECYAEPVPPSGPAIFTVTITNTGDVPLLITADDGIGSFQLAAGAFQEFSVSEPGPFTPGGTADNTVTASWTLPPEYGLSNTDSASASDSCDVAEPVYETAFALGDDAVCFTELGAGNWGWVNGNGTTSILPGTYEWPVWAGAAQCDTNNGTYVGTVTVNYTGTDVLVTWNIIAPYILGDTHVYAGPDQIPPGGFSPGQYQVYGPFSGEAIYIIVHAVVGIP